MQSAVADAFQRWSSGSKEAQERPRLGANGGRRRQEGREAPRPEAPPPEGPRGPRQGAETRRRKLAAHLSCFCCKGTIYIRPRRRFAPQVFNFLTRFRVVVFAVFLQSRLLLRGQRSRRLNVPFTAAAAHTTPAGSCCFSLNGRLGEKSGVLDK